MAEPTIEQVFGANSTQNLDDWVISKSDLQSVGLTPSATNTAESLFVALFLMAKIYLNQINQQTNPDIQVTIEDGFPSLVERNGITYRQRSFNVYLETPDSGSEIDPDNF
ncbi:hypothetical protein [Coleofasciculus sp.]|uniref:hypothetical protein n=1 Tax=Coleofasciculus sp. TaxID=3100458 RepID=UPI0039FB6966